MARSGPDPDVMIEKARRTLHRGYRKALANVRAVLNGTDAESHQKWKDASARVRGSFLMAQAFVGQERARVASEAPRTLGIVLVTDRLSSNDEWERMAVDVNRKAIEAVEVKSEVPRQGVQREPGPVGGVSPELGPGVSRGEEPGRGPVDISQESEDAGRREAQGKEG